MKHFDPAPWPKHARLGLIQKRQIMTEYRSYKGSGSAHKRALMADRHGVPLARLQQSIHRWSNAIDDRTTPAPKTKGTPLARQRLSPNEKSNVIDEYRSYDGPDLGHARERVRMADRLGVSAANLSLSVARWENEGVMRKPKSNGKSPDILLLEALLADVSNITWDSHSSGRFQGRWRGILITCTEHRIQFGEVSFAQDLPSRTCLYPAIRAAWITVLLAKTHEPEDNK